MQGWNPPVGIPLKKFILTFIEFSAIKILKIQ
jgi:hypothetical protein